MASEPRRLGDFAIVREIGRGGMGVVYEATQLSLGRRVALKVLPPGTTPEQRDIERFQREARAAAQLDHPHIVPIYAQGEEEGTYYYAMKLVQGRSLDQIIHDVRGINLQACTRTDFERTITADLQATLTLDEGALPPPEEGVPGQPPPERRRPTDLSLRYFRTAARITMEVAEALEYAHSQGVIHRDIKPHNLILTPDSHLVITDFGLARFLSAPSITISGEMMGTPAYMSPEQVRAEHQVIDHRTDIYSLGVTLYELLALEVPFTADTREAILRQILMNDPPPLRRLNPRIPRDLETICHRAIEKDPERRYQSAKLLAHDLRCFLEGLPITARPIGPLGRLYRRALRRRALTTAMAGICVALLVGSYFGIQSYRAQQQAEVQRRRAEAKERLAEEERGRTEAEKSRAEAERRAKEAEAAAKLEAQRLAELEKRRAEAERQAKEAEAAAKSELQRRNLLAQACSMIAGESYSAALRKLAEAATIRHDSGTQALLWIVANKYEEARILGRHGVPAYCVAFSPDGKVVASGSYNIKLWDASTGRVLSTLRKEAACLAFAPDGATLASGERLAARG